MFRIYGDQKLNVSYMKTDAYMVVPKAVGDMCFHLGVEDELYEENYAMDKPRLEKTKSALKVEYKVVEVVEEEPEVTLNDFDIPGVTRVVLSPITQKAIGCVIGENVTSENPWIYVKKEKLEDNLDINEDTSEFLPIKQEILEYPERDLLLGYDKSLIEERKEFYICVTTDAKDIVLNILEKEKDEMHERLKNCIEKTPGKWRSMGSEQEIEENVIGNLRPLIEIEVESKYPLYDTKIKFSMRPVEAVADGYVELLPGRMPINNIFKRRVDVALQVAADTTLHEVQTNPTYPLNTWTQYHYEYTDKHLDENNIARALNVIKHKAEDVCDMIRVNEFINLHTNDYASLVKTPYSPTSIDTDEVFSFHDVLSCKGKKVSSLCWHPLISGIIAVAYVLLPQHDIYSDLSSNDKITDAIYSQNLVLVWCYSESLAPKLYFQAPSEVNCISFCQQNPNILVGGCTNGQIVLWDIKNKIEDVETSEKLTPKQKKHRVIVHGFMNWIKNVKDFALIQPTIVTNISYGHKASVTDITWISSDYEVTRDGLIEELENGNGSVQFFTSGLDGVVYLWDLNQKPTEDMKVCPSNISKRFHKQPSALFVQTSDMLVLNKVLVPQYKLEIQDIVTKHAIPVTNMKIDIPLFNYTPKNPETLKYPLQRTYFSMSRSDKPFQFKPEILITSSTGQILKCTWEGYEGNTDETLNSEILQSTPFQNIHDGPIKSCFKNPFLPNVLLTVGGSVFATWNIENTESPILWRKSIVRYLAGVWSSYHPGVVVIARRDANFEIWDFHQSTKAPVRLVHLSGNVFIDGFTDTTKVHTRKNMCCTADALGALRFYKLPEYLCTSHENLLKYATKELVRTGTRRTLLKKWVSDWKEKYIVREPKQQEKPCYVYGKKVEEQPDTKEDKSKDLTTRREIENFDKMTSLKWNVKEKKVMYKIIFDKKNMDIDLIKEKIEPMKRMKENEHVKKHKLKTILALEDKIFDKTEKLLCTKSIMLERKEITVSLSEEDAAYAKKAYITAYQNMKPQILQRIKNNQFKPSFNWNNMISKGRVRRSVLTNIGQKEITHKKRYLNQKKAEQNKFEEKVSARSQDSDMKISLELKGTTQD
ncbi:missing minor mitochondria [Carabus blaptoides fortunei]